MVYIIIIMLSRSPSLYLPHALAAIPNLETKCSLYTLGNATLVLTKRRTIDPDVDCPGDNITLMCSITSNIDALEVTWIITLGQEKRNITLDANTVLGREQSVAMNMFVTLEDFVKANHAVSRFTIVPEIGVDQPRTLLQCTVRGLVSSSVIAIDVVNPTGKYDSLGQSDHVLCMSHHLLNQSTPYFALGICGVTSLDWSKACDITVTIEYYSWVHACVTKSLLSSPISLLWHLSASLSCIACNSDAVKGLINPLIGRGQSSPALLTNADGEKLVDTDIGCRFLDVPRLPTADWRWLRGARHFWMASALFSRLES